MAASVEIEIFLDRSRFEGDTPARVTLQRRKPSRKTPVLQ